MRLIKRLNTAGLIIIILVLSGCGAKERNTLATVDFSVGYPKKKLSYQDIGGKIEYVPLETSDEVLLSKEASIIYISDTKIVAVNKPEGDVFFFGRDGKILSHFNRKGQSGEEYYTLYRAVYDEKNAELFVAGYNKINVYSETGEYKRSLPNPEKTRYEHIVSFDDETFLVYDEYDIHGDGYRTKPYLFVSKKDGSIVSELDLNLSKRYTNHVLGQRSGEEAVSRIATWVYRHWYDGDDFVISDVSSDTVYQLTRDKKLIPLLARTPSKHSDGARLMTFLTVEFKTGKFMYMQRKTVDREDLKHGEDSGDDAETSNLLYSFADGQIFETWLDNADCMCYNDIGNTKMPKNSILALIPADIIVDRHEKGKVSGELKKIAEKLDPEANPVIAIIKFQ